MENNYIDEMVRDSIGEYEMAFDPADWDAMEEHLETDNRVRRKLYATKAIEACLMLVTVWTIMQFVEIDNSASYQPTLIEHQETLPPSVEDNQVAPLPTNDSQKNGNSAKPIQQQKELNPLLKDVPIANNALKTFERTIIENQTDEVIQINDNKESKNIDFKKIIDESTIIPIASLEPKMFDVNDKVFLKPIDLGLEEYEIKKEKSRKYRIAATVGTTIFNKAIVKNQIYSLADVAENSEIYNVIGGVTIDRKLAKKLRIETGALLISQKDKVTIGSNIGVTVTNESLSSIRTSSIEIPVNVLYEICSNEKNVIYALGGLSNYFRLSVENEYEYAIQYNQNYPIIPNVDNTTERVDGLLINKEMPDNHYASVNVGAGYERKLNKRLSLFAQGTFKRSFGKEGFEQDDMATVSLSAGVKSVL